MNPELPGLTEHNDQYSPLPPIGLPVQVQCDGFKSMAFRDQNGQWVDFFTQERLPRVLGVVRA